MLAIKRLVTVLVMVFVLLGVLLILVPSVRASAEGMFGSGPVGLYYALFITGLVLLGLQLITENLDSVLLRREVATHTGKINELKARLYDQQAALREREFQQRPVEVAAPVAPAPTTIVTPVVAAPTTTYAPETGRAIPGQPGHDVEHPTFPQSDPGLANVSLDQPNTVISPPPAPDSTIRPAQ
jgi:hypothetical protein